jgi:hypothetical protein
MKTLELVIERNLSKILKDFTSKTYDEKTANGKIIIDSAIVDKVINEVKSQANFSVVELNKEIDGMKFESTFLMKDGEPYICDEMIQDGQKITGYKFDAVGCYKALS